MCCLCLLLSLFVFSVSADSVNIVNDFTNYDCACLNGYGEEWTPAFHDEVYIGYQGLNLSSGAKISFTARSKTLNLSAGYTYTFSWTLYYNFALGDPPLSNPYVNLVHSGGDYQTIKSTLTGTNQASGGNYYDYTTTVTTTETVALEFGLNYKATSTVSGGYFYLALSNPIIQTPINDAITDEIISNQEQNKEEIIANQDANTEKVGGWLNQLANSIKGWFSDLLNGIIEGLKNLFIPSQEKLDTFFTALNEWMNDHFGFLYYPFSVLIDFCNRLLTYNPPENPSITFPALTVGDYTLLEAKEYNLATEALPIMGQWRQYYVIGVNCIIGFWLVNLARIKLNSIMSGGGE